MKTSYLKAFQPLRETQQKWDTLLTKTSQLDIVKAGVTANSKITLVPPTGGGNGLKTEGVKVKGVKATNIRFLAII